MPYNIQASLQPGDTVVMPVAITITGWNNFVNLAYAIGDSATLPTTYGDLTTVTAGIVYTTESFEVTLQPGFSSASFRTTITSAWSVGALLWVLAFASFPTSPTDVPAAVTGPFVVTH